MRPHSHPAHPFPRLASSLLILPAVILLVSCRDGSAPATTAAPATTSVPAGGAVTTPTTPGTFASSTTAASGPVTLEVKDVVTGLETVWSLAWDPEGALWFTERPGRLTKVGQPARAIEGVVEAGEGGLMGLDIDRQGRIFLMYTAATDNRIVRLEADGSQRSLVEGIRKATNHNGGRIRFGPDGRLWAGTGDGQDQSLPQDDGSVNGKIISIDPETGNADYVAKGMRNSQGLCFAPDGRLYVTEHGPDRGDEINVIAGSFDGGWPGTTGNGIKNWTPTIAPAGCAFYDADLIPQWRGSLLFVTLKEADLRRLTFNGDGSVAGEEVLYDEEYGRLRDVRVGPDGAVYVTTSNHDGRGSPGAGDDRILRIAPAGR